MSFEPQKFFIGLIDFFSILLPGALLTYMIKDDLGPSFFGAGYTALPETTAWAVFLFGSYLLGHMIFLLGSWRLDDWYDDIRNATYEQQIKQLADGKRLRSRLNRWLAARLFKPYIDQALDLAVRIKTHYLSLLGDSSSINTFQWSKARLTLAHPEAIATVQRFEADSKFFRSLLIVVCVLIPWGLFKQQSATMMVFYALLLVLAFWRYADQRLKATNQAYWYIITLESLAKDGDRFRQHTSDAVERPSHAGGVVYRTRSGRVEYLLVQAKGDAQEWVLPKGHVEPHETTAQAAVREVREETGVWASIRGDLPIVLFQVHDTYVRVQFYLMEACEEGKPTESRAHRWLALEAALDLATHQETQETLSAAETRRAQIR